MTESRTVAGGGEVNAKGHEGNLGDDRNILYFDCGGDYTGKYICQNISNDTIKFDELYCIQIILQ